MAVNVNAARDQANQITNQIAGLKRAKTQLTDYKSSLAANWSGAEVRYVSKGIDQVVRQIDDVINRLTSLSNAINRRRRQSRGKKMLRQEQRLRLLPGQRLRELPRPSPI